MPKAAWLLLFALPALVFADELGDQLLAATRKGDLAAVKALLDKGADVNTKTRYDSTPLFFACDRGYLDIVRLLIERGAKMDVHDNFYNASAIGWAVNHKHDAVVELMVEKGADPSDVLGDSIQNGNQKRFDFVLAKGKLTQTMLDEALLMAETSKRTEMAKALEAKGAKKLEIQVDAATLASYAGKYAEGDMAFNFAVADGKLTFQQGSGTAAKLIAFAKDKFKFLAAGLDFSFARDAAGAVTSVSFNSRGGDVTLKKVATK